ncbi:MAG TPA: hypothetical protein VFJ58_25400 [Armatimonadota bacterium]|nr:hypothetical protein [Armatimonadota bacterium]
MSDSLKRCPACLQFVGHSLLQCPYCDHLLPASEAPTLLGSGAGSQITHVQPLSLSPRTLRYTRPRPRLSLPAWNPAAVALIVLSLAYFGFLIFRVWHDVQPYLPDNGCACIDPRS